MRTRQTLRRLEAPLAVATLLVILVDVRSPPQRFPSWLEVGALSLPTMSLYPVPVALLVVAVTAATYSREGSVEAGRLLTAVLAALVVLSAAYAVVVLNLAAGGVFFAGFPPLVLGVLLCSVLVADVAVEAVRRLYGSAG